MPNPTTIFIVSQKGGVGKSTIAEEIAYSLDRSSIPYCYYDWDGQGGSHHKTQEVDNPTVAIVDTPAGLSEDTRQNLSAADLVVIATKTTPRDVIPLERTLELVRLSTSCPVLVVVTHFSERYRLSQEFLVYIGGRVGAANVMTLPLSEVFPQSDMAEKSVVEYMPRHKAAQATLALVERVRSLAGLPPEHDPLQTASVSNTVQYKELPDNSKWR